VPVPCTDSTTRGLPKLDDAEQYSARAADGARPATAAVCEHLLGDTFSAPALERRPGWVADREST
jgi:hypothetical protein